MTLFTSAAAAHAVGAPLVRLFVTALGRIPDEIGLRALVERRRRGEDLPQIASTLTGITEFLARHGPTGPPDEHYLRALFWAVDGEDPADEDATLLAPFATRASVLLAVSQSPRARDAIGLAENLYPDGLLPEDDLAYQLWLEAGHDVAKTDTLALVRHAAGLPRALVSLVVPVPTARPDLLEETIASLRAQIWPHWECLLLCPDTLPPHVWRAIERLAVEVPAVRLVAAPIAAAEAANAALAEAGGVLVGWLDAGDRLAPTALYEAAAALATAPRLRLIYTDEDLIAGDGTRFRPVLKAGWSPDLLLTGDSLGQLVLFSREAARAAGGFSAAAAPFERYELCLRLTDDAPLDAVRHIPAILFHRGRRSDAARSSRSHAVPPDSSLGQIVVRHLRAHQPGLLLGERLQGQTAWPVLLATLPQPPPRVSVIILVRDQAALLEHCLEGLLTRTDYPAIEVLVIDNDSQEAETLALLQRARHDERVRVLPQPGRYNWSALNNAGAAAATGDVLLLLNNDIEVLEPDWLARLVGHALRPAVGAVGARLLFSDNTLQHGGMLLSPKERAVHAMTHAVESEAGYLGQIALPRDMSAVTGACLAIRRTVFEEVGGLHEQALYAQSLHLGCSDVDLCLRVRRAGYRVLWLPDVVLTYHETAPLERDVATEQQVRQEIEYTALRQRWPAETDRDPFLNPNLEATATSIVLARPSRRLPPWARDEEVAA